MASDVNISSSHPGDVKRALGDVLLRLLSGASWLKGWSVESAKGKEGPWDLRAAGTIPRGGKAVLCVACKRHFQPSQFQSVVDRRCDIGRFKIVSRVLAMPRVSPRMAALCQTHGWSWYDLAGNCRLEIPGVLLIERSGNEPVKTGPRADANLGTPEAGRVVRALLAPENAGQRWTRMAMGASRTRRSPRETYRRRLCANRGHGLP